MRFQFQSGPPNIPVKNSVRKNPISMSKRKRVKEGDDMRARVISISMGRQYKIGLTTRQPNMGVLEWFEKEKRQAAAQKTVAKPAEVNK